MKYIGLAAFGAAALYASVGLAANMQMSQSECTNLWQQANASNLPGLTEAQSSAYITDFKAANPDGDATIDQNEWMAACNKGLIKNASSSGASTGASGKTSDRTPGNPAPSRTPGATSTGAAGTDAGQTPEGTSDRTPNK